MGKMRFGGIHLWQLYNSANEYSINANVNDESEKVEMFDAFEYNENNPESSLIKITPDYARTLYYTEKIAPLLYENKDVEDLIGDYKVPNDVNVVILAMKTTDLSLTSTDFKTGVHSGFIYSSCAINNFMQKYMDLDYNEILTKLVNVYIQNDSEPKIGIKNLLNTNQLPWLIRGAYPVIFKYQLPGKNVVTSEYVINLKY